MTRPLVSVVIPAFNAGAFLEAALHSVRAQTVAGSEIIVIDDGSTDATLKVAQAQARQDARIRVVSRENRGLVATLNEGVALAEGEWVARMDADDVCLPRRFEHQLAWAAKQGAALCGGWIQTFATLTPRLRRYYSGPEAVRLQLLFNSCFAHPAVIARREVLQAHPYDAAAAHAEDYDLWTRLAAAGVRMTNYPGTVLRYRLHAGQVTVTRRTQQDEARARIAARYRQACFPEFAVTAHERIMSRLTLLPATAVLAAGDALAQLAAASGNPEGVVTDNAFLFLARHAEIGAANMSRAMQPFAFGQKRRAILAVLALLDAHQHSRLFTWLYGMR